MPTAFYVDDLDAEVAQILDETIAVLKREGASIVPVELPDQRQLTAACQLVLAVEAAAFHKRWLIERPAGLRPAGSDAAAERACDPRRLLSRGDALARPGAGRVSMRPSAGVDAVIAPVAPVAAPTIAESDVGNSPDAEAVIQRLTRFTRPINYLGLPSLAIPVRFYARAVFPSACS